jgi:hypothetical protein
MNITLLGHLEPSRGGAWSDAKNNRAVEVQTVPEALTLGSLPSK